MTPAESSPAPVVNETVYLPSREERLAAMKAPPEPAKAPAKEAQENPEKGTSVQTEASASEPGKGNQEPKKKGEAARRMEELIEDFKAAGLTPADLKTFKENYQRKEVKTEAAQVAPEQTAKPVDPKAPVKPKAADFEGKPWEEYEAARDKYFEDLADYKAAQAIEGLTARQKQEATSNELNTRIEALSKQYGADAREPIQSAAKQVFEDPKVNGIVKEMVNGSPVLVDVLYTLGGDEAGLADFLADARSNPGAAIRKFVLLEKLVTEELAKGSTESQPERGEDGKFKAPPEKKTAAPPPPKEVSGRGSAPPDEVESATQAALKGDDAGPAIEAMRRARLRRLKGL